MTWAEDLKRVRYFLRDPNGKVWSDEFLRHIYNDVTKDFQHKTSIAEEILVQRVPGVYHMAYMHDWEYEHLPSKYSTFYQCLNQHDEGVFCHRWEPQEVTDIDSDVSDYGAHFTQPWEAFMGEVPADPVRMSFPKNMRNLKFIAYDREPITQISKKRLQSYDMSYLTKSGEPCWYYELDDVDDSYVLYPRPSTAWLDELDDNEGPAWYIEDDTEDVTTGTIAVRIGSTGSDNVGVPFDITDTVKNVTLIYDVHPHDVEIAWDDSAIPVYLRKYVIYGTVSRAYGANTDGRIPSLAQYWRFRYDEGVKRTYRLRRNKQNDRDYRLRTKVVGPQRTRRHPRLPDGYPAVNP